MRIRLLLLTAIILSIGFAPAPLPKPPKYDPVRDDPKRLSGTWDMVSRTMAGKTVSHIVHNTEIANGKLTLVNKAGDWRSPFRLTLDPGKKPRWFDTQSEKGTYRMCGIYDLDGDSLKMYYTSNGIRPTGFDANATGVYLDVYKRRKP